MDILIYSGRCQSEFIHHTNIAIHHFRHPRSLPPTISLVWTRPLAANSQPQLQRHSSRPLHSTPGPLPQPPPPAMEEYLRHSRSRQLPATTPSSHRLPQQPLLLRPVLHRQIHGELRVKVQVIIMVMYM